MWQISALAPKADMARRGRHVCFVPKADILVPYSITSSARASTEGGTVRPSALAVLRLIINSNLVGCSTGRSEGLVPLRILSTYPPERKNKSGTSGPYEINPPLVANSRLI